MKNKICSCGQLDEKFEALLLSSGQVSRGSAGEYQADEGEVSRALPGDYQSDQRAGVARLSWRVSGR